MNKYVLSETKQHTMKLIQMGAQVTVVSSKMVYVSFDITDTLAVAYVYNVNKKNKYFLERIKPYPLSIKEFDTADDVIEIIKVDVAQFKNAVQSHNIQEFVAINTELHKALKSFEDLFLYYNVPTQCFKSVHDSVINIQDAIMKTKETSERVYFDKDPENLD